MKVLYNWLKEYVDIKDGPDDLVEVFTHLGIEVEEIRHLKDGLCGLKTGIIEDVRPHPKKSDYKIVYIKLKDGTLKCVSSSEGLHRGRFVFVATEGTVLPHGRVLKKDVYGEISEGNIVSLEDLGLADESKTVFFPQNVSLETSPLEYLGLDDVLYELYITPNRPDLFGYIGIAADLAAYYNEKVHIPPYGVEECADIDVPPIKIEDKDACPRYTARVIEDVKVKESPFWLARKLYLSGIRPISNIVDVTNYVLLEFGHPLHAFDKNKLESEVIVRRAASKEHFLALDGKEYELDEENLVIADRKGPIAIAGIIGGEETKVDENTTSVLLESAYFNPGIVSRGVLRLNLKTESGIRFMKGADMCIPPIASSRASRLIAELAGGRVSHLVDVGEKGQEKNIVVRVSRISEIIGEEVDEDKLIGLFQRMGFSFKEERKGTYSVHIPTRRRDIEGEPDIAEEYLRYMGFDLVSQRLHVPDDSPGDVPLDKWFNIKDLILSQGYWETKNIEFISLKEHEWFSRTKPIKLANPLSPDMAIMRSSLLPGLLRSGAMNIRYGNEDVKLFELGRVFLGEKGENTPFKEVMRLSAFVGGYTSKTLYQEKRLMDFYDIKGVLDALSHYFMIDYTLRVSTNTLPGFAFSVDILKDDKVVGVIGEVSEKVLKFLELKIPVFVMELDASSIEVHPYKFKEFSRYPSIRRDISILVPSGTLFGHIKELIEKANIPYLKSILLVDVFKNRKTLGDKTSFTISLLFESQSATLESSEVDTQVNKVLELLLENGYKQRT